MDKMPVGWSSTLSWVKSESYLPERHFTISHFLAVKLFAAISMHVLKQNSSSKRVV